ncbi:unnamed protein product [Ambrosiozyma monospora]|uniref:Unnamed protein product n=1 Tax=Ambrosiozyma monospora TaxID=43982 RepID=A0ACB5TDL2_AMBMO|nr:unnamed protein product [Ambrosiozyma monospora]
MNNAKQSDIAVRQQLISSSDEFLKSAHSLAPRNVKSEVYVTYYNKLIKCSVSCLLIVVERYKATLDAGLEVSVYLKLSQILFNETVSYDLASDYCLKALQLISRTGDTMSNFKLKAQVLNFQIQV